jgi:hypothetical protein
MWCFSVAEKNTTHEFEWLDGPAIQEELPLMNLRVRDCSYTTANDVLAGKAVCDFDLKTDLFSWLDEDV